MTFLEFWMRSESAKALGWTLVHSLWEGAAIALALAIVLGIARSSRVRYAAACLAMLSFVVGFGITFWRLAPREISRPVEVRPLPQWVNPAVEARPVANGRTPFDASELLPFLAPIWLAGVLLFQLRYLAAWAAAGRFRRTGVCGASYEWTEKLDDLRARLRMTRPVTLLESCFAEVPVVIGHLRPVILMPVGLLAGLPAGQVEAILLHELAHIRRADYLVNLMQTLVEGLFFYHPAAWWISSVIRNERENCCDDLVVLTSGDAHAYATALAALAEDRWTMREGALAATGGNLAKRIRRLLFQAEGPRIPVAPMLSAGILVVTGVVALAAWETPAPQGPAVPVPSSWAHPLAMAMAQAQTPPPPPHASPYEKWLLEEAVYIITDEERAEFKKLETDAQRAHFIEQFWKRRDPTPDTPENEYRDEHYRRIAYANSRFKTPSGLPGWKTDRGRIYIEYGPPDEIDSHPAGGAYMRPSEQGGTATVTYPFEQWRYRFIEGIGKNITLEFVDKGKTGDFRLTMDPAEKEIAPPPPPEAELAVQAARLEHQAALQSLSQRRILEDQAQKLMEIADQRLRVLENQVKSMPEQDLMARRALIEEAEKNMQIADERLRALEQQLKSQAPDLLESQTQLRKLEAAVRDIERESNEPMQKQLQLVQDHFPDQVLEQQLMRSLHALPEVPAGPSSVFVSGSGPQAAVVVLPNRRMLVTVPIEFPAGRCSISVTAMALDGTKLWSAAKETSQNGSLTIEGLPLEPGSYTLKASVKDPAGSAEKTYVVNFSVK